MSKQVDERERKKAWHRAHPEYIQNWRKTHPDKLRGYGRAWNAANPEQKSVIAHHGYIFHRQDRAYIGMPFFDAWNPDRRGSFVLGAQWVITNLGRRPSKQHQLHIVDRKIGFVPGNLAWVPREKHQQEELINRLLLENQQLKKELGRTI